MAETIYNSKVTDKKAFSAGLNAPKNENASHNAIDVCANHEIDLSSHHTINVEDIPMEKMDLIFTSSILQRDALISKYPDLNISP